MRLEDSLHIDAPTDVVWRVTVEVERWPEWTTTVAAVRRLDTGPFGLDSRARIDQPGLPEAEWVVTSFTPERNFTWETRVRTLKMTATHDLSREGTGTRSILRVEIRGALAVLLWPLLRSAARRSLARENESLRRECESLARRDA